MTWLIDTNIISELVATQPDDKVLQWITGVDSEEFYLSVITIGELKRGVEKLPDSRRRRRLNAWLQGDLMVRFAGQILPIDQEVALTWGKLLARLEAVGRPMPAIDSLLAATAIAHGLTLVTRNISDFEAAGVPLFNPWEFES